MSDEDFDENDYLLSIQTGVERKSAPKMGFCDCFTCLLCCKCCSSWFKNCCGHIELRERTIYIGSPTTESFPPNSIRNQKYSLLTFLPLVLVQQFKSFLNLYFLSMAISQFWPKIRLGYLYTYWGPLIFVITVTLIREAVDDIRRYKRDKEVNSQKYGRLTKRPDGIVITEYIPSSDIRVGDLIKIDKDQRVPADLALLRTAERSGSCFIRTDQLDGETDWKLRRALPTTQKLDSDYKLFNIQASLYVEKPCRDIYNFIGNFKSELSAQDEGLNIENTLWANSALASGTALGIVLYTGKETRSVMNNSQPRSKTGLLDSEINHLAVLLFFALVGLSLLMMFLKGFSGHWYLYLIRFLLLFSYIIPLSLRVNLDMGKIFYSFQMQQDKKMAGCVVRCTTIPEELGRVSYLLTDKTGTLTQNSMEFQKLHVPSPSKTEGQPLSRSESAIIQKAVSDKFTQSQTPMLKEDTLADRIYEAVKAVALCHNVTPCLNSEDEQSPSGPMTFQSEFDKEYWASRHGSINYQASSPDEVALVKWSEEIGLAVISRTISTMRLRTPINTFMNFSILQLFPFDSDSKRMGIIVKDADTGEITFYLKGADVVMKNIVLHLDWLVEKVTDMARDGLRTLVVAKKPLTQEQYQDFEAKYNAANSMTKDRKSALAAVVAQLERDMELVCITGVEDKLQDLVKETLESLKRAGIKIWMLTGDKLETAICIAKSSALISRQEHIYIFEDVPNDTEIRTHVHAQIRNANRGSYTLVFTGTMLEHCLNFYEDEFMELVTKSRGVVCCRCSPTQKAIVVEKIKKHTKKRTAAVGDGGNDVSMIQAADVGIGIAGKEGKQASLAADFSIIEFSSLTRLLFIHGRHSYQRSASLSQFVIHRGLIISTMQAIFSAVFYFSSVSLFPGFFMVAYATIFTMFPVFSLVFDEDDPKLTLNFPELYKELAKGRSLSYKTFFIWVLKSVFQGGVIMYVAILLFVDEFIHIVAISFSALILTELIMVALTVRTWHYFMMLAEIFSLVIYILSLVILKDYFDPVFLTQVDFLWKVAVITLLSCLPLICVKICMYVYYPTTYQKLQLSMASSPNDCDTD